MRVGLGWRLVAGGALLLSLTVMAIVYAGWVAFVGGRTRRKGKLALVAAAVALSDRARPQRALSLLTAQRLWHGLSGRRV
jgi:hypothetical protein